MRWTRTGVALAAALTCAVAVAPVGFGAQPTITREAIDDTFDDEFLTDFNAWMRGAISRASGTSGVRSGSVKVRTTAPVETHAVGHQITRTYTDDSGRLIEVFTINVSVTSTSEEGTFRVRDVGADVTRITKDGVVHQIIGKLPFWFNGTAWVDPATDEIIKGPTGSDLFESTLDKACAALAP